MALAADRFRRDLAQAFRSLRRTPAFTVTIVLILALTIGMASAMFTVFQRVLVQRLPVDRQDRIVELRAVGRGAAAKEFPLGGEQYRRFRNATRTLTSVAAFAHWRTDASAVMDGGRSIVLRVANVTDGFFHVLGSKAAVGHLFQPGEGVPIGAAATAAPVVLSYDAWQRIFGGDSSIVGRHLGWPKVGWTLTVVGVAPPGLDYPRGTQCWVAADYGSLDVVGRLAPGVTPTAARDEFASILASDPDLQRDFGSQAVAGAEAYPLEQMVVGDAKPALTALSAAVALLLLLACVNVGNLLLLRGAARGRELAIRQAIGARTADLLRPLLWEGVLLAVAGGVLGVGLARALLTGLVWLGAGTLPRLGSVRLAGAPLAMAAAVTVLATVLFAIGPSIATVRLNLARPLHADPRAGTEGRGLRRTRRALVASQVALAVMVLAGAGLLGRSFARLAGLNLGFPREHLALLNVSLPTQSWRVQCNAERPVRTPADSARLSACLDERDFDYHDRVMTQLRRLPAIVSVSPVAAPPFLGASVWSTRIVPEGRPESELNDYPFFGVDAVGPEYFRTMGLPILEGRAFTAADREHAPAVAIVSEGVARRLWPNQHVIGKRFHAPGDSLVTIVGLTRDLHFRELKDATPMVFRPFRQVYAQGYFVVKTRAALATVLPAMRRAVTAADPDAVVADARTVDQLIAPHLATPRFEALLLATFALAALLLAAIGLHGIMAYTVRQQTRELGVRMALGATAGRLRSMVLRQALVITGIGAVIGLAGGLAGSRLLASLLFHVSPEDPLTLGGVAALLILVALLAAYLPARRATGIDPAAVLRAE